MALLATAIEYLRVKPIKISIRHEKRNLLGLAYFKIYRQLRLTLTSIRDRILIVAQQIGFGNKSVGAVYITDGLGRELFKKRSHNNKKNNYFDSSKLIPEPVSSILDEEYMKILNLPVQKRSMILPEC